MNGFVAHEGEKVACWGCLLGGFNQFADALLFEVGVIASGVVAVHVAVEVCIVAFARSI